MSMLYWYTSMLRIALEKILTHRRQQRTVFRFQRNFKNFLTVLLSKKTKYEMPCAVIYIRSLFVRLSANFLLADQCTHVGSDMYANELLWQCAGNGHHGNTAKMPILFCIFFWRRILGCSLWSRWKQYSLSNCQTFWLLRLTWTNPAASADYIGYCTLAGIVFRVVRVRPSA